MIYLDQVIEVAQHVPIFPCRAKTSIVRGKEFRRKRPHITKFKERASQDPKQIREWWKRWPDAMVGMPTGLRSGIYAIDFDAPDGDDPFQMLNYLPGEVDEFVLMQRTKRGLHLLFEMDKDRPLRNGTDVFHKHIDTRGEGGYIVIAPSEGYTMLGDWDDLQPVPGWVYTFLREKVKRTRSKKGDEIKSAETVIKTLNLLDPTKYQSYEDWVKIMLACYHGSDADEQVKDAFKEWSSQDPDAYDENTDDQIDSQWESAATDIESILTYKTLRHEVTKHHGAVVIDGENPFEEDEFSQFDDIDDDDIKAVPASVRLDSNSRGKVESSTANLRKMLTAAALQQRPNQLRGIFKFNEMTQRVEFKKTPPWAWDGHDMVNKVFDDSQATNLQVYLSGMYKTNFFLSDILRAVTNAAVEEEVYHPVRKYLNGLEWDRRKRIHRWIPNIVGAKDTPYHREVGRRFLISAVSRAMNPGNQVDTMPVFEGNQGIYKSSMVQILGGDWYRAPSLRDLSSKESIVSCLGAWFIELEEMGALKHTQIEFIKKFITTRRDAVRLAYDKFVTDIPRSFVLVGTMNPTGDNQYIHDVTGARRFWPIECPANIKLDKLREERDQLFAEAMKEYRQQKPWWFTDKEDRVLMVKEVQRQRQAEDPWYETIYDYLYYGAGRNAPSIMPSEIWTDALQGFKSLTNNKESNRIKRIVVNMLGWELKSTNWQSDGTRGTSRRRYCRPEWELELMGFYDNNK